MRTMKKFTWVLLASLTMAAPVAAQSQFQSTFEVGIGYTRPASGDIDMASLLIQADDFLLESGIGIRTNSGVNGDAVFSWLLRGGLRPFLLGNLTGHVGGEFSLHTNSTVKIENTVLGPRAEPNTLLGLGIFAGVSHQVADHLNLAVHVYPFAFEFGGEDTVTKFLVGEFSAHILF